MKLQRLRSIVLAAGGLAAAFLAGSLAENLRAARRPPAEAQAQAPSVPRGNGDINADGGIDLSDAVSLINYLFLAGAPPVEIACAPARDLTVVVVRHCEKEATGTDPDLTPAGQVRATHLRDTLAPAHIDAVFSTQYKRTIETVQAVADTHPPLQVQTLGDNDIVTALRALPSGSVVVVAGNSFNIPDILSGLGLSGDDVPTPFPSAEFDNLWVVRYGSSPAAGASVTHLKYWQP
jgi:histidine phosphatase superfamily protein (branch 1)